MQEGSDPLSGTPFQDGSGRIGTGGGRDNDSASMARGKQIGALVCKPCPFQ